jgi:hypothetical protein
MQCRSIVRTYLACAFLQDSYRPNAFAKPSKKTKGLKPVKELVSQESMHRTIVGKHDVAPLEVADPVQACILELLWETVLLLSII